MRFVIKVLCFGIYFFFVRYYKFMFVLSVIGIVDNNLDDFLEIEMVVLW